MKVLIVDDEKPVRDSIKLLVNWEEYNIDIVLEAENGQEAIQIIKKETPELVLSDIMMPTTDGVQLMEWIYNSKYQCKVIAISGYTDYDYIRQIFLHGGSDYILKPIQPEKLYSALKKSISDIEKEKFENTPILSEPTVFNQIKVYINQNYNQELSLKDIAAKFHFSEVYLSHKFKKVYGITLVQYIKSVRINHAKKYLLHSQKKVSEIANLVGYDDVKYFSRVFKEMEDTSPFEYRKKLQ